MACFQWGSAHAVYLPDVDAEHRALFRMASDLNEAVLAGAPEARIKSVLHDLAVHVEEHFTHEERLMHAAHYPAYGWHKAQHDAARQTLASFARRVSRHDRKAPLEFVNFLADWLENHATVSDRMMGAYFRNYERAHARQAG